MKIALGSDHAGFQYKEPIKLFLSEAGHEVADFGTDSQEPVDYPSFILSVAQAVAQGDFERGVVLGGSGNGEAITANRFAGIRCTLCWNLRSARLARQHNDANVLALGQRMMRLERALAIVEVWLKTPFQEGNHARRLKLIDRPLNSRPPRNDRLAKRTPIQQEASFVGEEFLGLGQSALPSTESSRAMSSEQGKDSVGSGSAPSIESISAVSLATRDMARAVQFYGSLGFTLRFGGEAASFTSWSAGSSYLNLIAQPTRQYSPWWGRVIFYVSDVDALYKRAIVLGLDPNHAPHDAAWGERYFHLTDPDGHEVSFARLLES